MGAVTSTCPFPGGRSGRAFRRIIEAGSEMVRTEGGRPRMVIRIRFPAATADGKKNGYGKAIGAGEKEHRFDADFQR